MAAVHGKSTTVLVNSTNLTGYLTATDLSVDVDTSDITTYGSGWKSGLTGLLDATVGFQGIYDPTLTQVLASVGVDGSILTYSPGSGSAIGDMARLLYVTGTTYSESSPVADVVTFAWDVHSESSVGLGQVLHPLGTDTNTTTGASKDDAAATTSGWTAHLHVTAVSSGSWALKLQDSADNSSWSDVTGGAFTAATGATQQRLTSASGATLRRYVRYVATVTGGSTPTITFALAYARNA